MAVTVSAVQHAKKSIWRPLRLLRAGVLTLANATRWGIAAAFGTAWLVTVDIESGVRWPHAAASGRSCGVTEIDRPSTIATAKKTAMVPLETGQPDQSPVESENGTPIENFLIIDVTLLSEDRMHPYALDITSVCAKDCFAVDASNRLHIGLITLFPSLKVGESRSLKILVTKETRAKLSDRLEVALKPIITGRTVGENIVRVNLAKLESGPL